MLPPALHPPPLNEGLLKAYTKLIWAFFNGGCLDLQNAKNNKHHYRAYIGLLADCFGHFFSACPTSLRNIHSLGTLEVQVYG